MDGQDNRLGQAASLIASGRGGEAIALLLEFTAADPSSFTGQSYLGMAYAQAQQFPNAIQAFQKAIALQPDNAATYYNLGVAYQRTGQLEAASKVYSRTLQLDPQHAKAAAALNYLRTQSVTAQPAPLLQGPAQMPPQPAAPQTRPVAARPITPRVGSRERSPSGANKFMIPIAIAVALAAAAGVYFLFFASNPKKVAEAYIAACKKLDFAKMAQLCTEDSKRYIDMQKQMMANVPKEFVKASIEQMVPRDLGDATIEGDTAKVAAKMNVKIPKSFSATSGWNSMSQLQDVEVKTSIVLLKEKHKWKVDIMKTQMEQGKDFLETPAGKAMMEEMKKKFPSMGSNPFTR